MTAELRDKELMNNTQFEVRLENLERRLKRYQLTSALLGLGLIGFVGIAANAPSETHQEVRTHKLMIVNESGKEVAHLVSGANGGLLSLLNNEGFPVFRAGAGEKGGKLTVSNAKGEQCAQVSSEDAGGEVLLQDKKGQKNLMKVSPSRTEK
jgi:hypothetical protein